MRQHTLSFLQILPCSHIPHSDFKGIHTSKDREILIVPEDIQ